MALETFLAGVRTELAADLGITVVDGYVEGPLERELACVYPGQTEENPDDVGIEEIEVLIRYFRPYQQQFTPEEPAATADLIEMRDAIVEALKDKQTVQWDVWYFRIAGFTFNPRSRWIEARLRAWQANPYAP